MRSSSAMTMTRRPRETGRDSRRRMRRGGHLDPRCTPCSRAAILWMAIRAPDTRAQSRLRGSPLDRIGEPTNAPTLASVVEEGAGTCFPVICHLRRNSSLRSRNRRLDFAGRVHAPRSASTVSAVSATSGTSVMPTPPLCGAADRSRRDERLRRALGDVRSLPAASAREHGPRSPRTNLKVQDASPRQSASGALFPGEPQRPALRAREGAWTSGSEAIARKRVPPTSIDPLERDGRGVPGDPLRGCDGHAATFPPASAVAASRAKRRRARGHVPARHTRHGLQAPESRPRNARGASHP